MFTLIACALLCQVTPELDDANFPGMRPSPVRGLNRAVAAALPDYQYTFKDLSNTQALLQRRREVYLRERQWVYDCANPGSIWLWRKTIDGREYFLELDMAVAIQVARDQASIDDSLPPAVDPLPPVASPLMRQANAHQRNAH